MRIIAGARKGLTLAVPQGLSVRPTPARVREAAMSILGGHLDGERVLDVCAGSGAMGLELLSRGAGLAVFLESDPVALAALRLNVSRARFGAAARVVERDAATAIVALGREGARFDLVWLDPPWDAELHLPLLRALDRADVVAGGGEIWVESARGVDIAAAGTAFVAVERRVYGSVTVDRLRRPAEDLVAADAAHDAGGADGAIP